MHHARVLADIVVLNIVFIIHKISKLFMLPGTITRSARRKRLKMWMMINDRRGSKGILPWPMCSKVSRDFNLILPACDWHLKRNGFKKLMFNRGAFFTASSLFVGKI
jgi:hypothetical protein